MSKNDQNTKTNINKNTAQKEEKMSKPIDTLTVLGCREPDKKAAKEFFREDDGSVTKKSFGAGTFFTHEEKPVSNLDDLSNVLTELMKEPQKFVIRGKPKPDAKNVVKRRIHDPGAAFDPMPRYYLALDIDKEKCPEHLDPVKDPDAVARWVRELLPAPFRAASFFYKFSASQSVPKKAGEKPESVISLHMWFWCDRAISEGEWKRYFRANPAPVDLALFSPVQIHYTANPVFHDMDDPLPQRSGIICGEHDVVTLPPIPEAEKRKPVERPDKAPNVSQDDRDKAIEMFLPYYEEGARDRLSGAVAGALYRGGWAAEDTADFVHRLAEADNDPDAMSRHDSAMRICEAIDNNRPAQGIPTLRDEFEIEELDEVLTLLGIGQIDIEAKISKLSKSSTLAEIEETVKLILSLPPAAHEIHLSEVKKQSEQTKAAINSIYKAVKKEERNRLSEDQAVMLMEMLLEEHYESGRLLIRIKDGNYYSYNGRHWEVEPEDSIKRKMLPLANELYNPEGMNVSPMVNAALNLLQGRVFKGGDPLRHNSTPPMVINCRNGEVWFDDKGQVTFKPHRPESYLRHCLSIDYDPAAKSPKFDKAVLDIFSTSSSPEELFKHIMEIIGYICQPWRKIPAILLLHGAGSNGKTSLAAILEYLLGEGNFMAERINDIEKNIFTIGALDGKLMLIDDDVEVGTCLPDGFLKKISEEKSMTGQHKNKPSFEFKCRAVPVLLSNHYPSTKDLSKGLRRRLMVVPFTREFSEEEIIPGLFDDIWVAESSGILNHAIAGFQRLKARGRFDEPQDCLNAKDTWLTRSNELVTFINEYCRLGPKQKQPLTEFYDRFKEYCEDAGIKNVPTRKGVKDRLESMGHDITPLNGYQTVRGVYAPAWSEVDQRGDALDVDDMLDEPANKNDGEEDRTLKS